MDYDKALPLKKPPESLLHFKGCIETGGFVFI